MAAARPAHRSLSVPRSLSCRCRRILGIRRRSHASFRSLDVKTSFTFAPLLSPENQKLLLIECAGQRFQQAQSFVQYAHETSLARDQIAKLTRPRANSWPG